MRVAYVCLDPGVPVFGRKGSSIHCQEMMRAFQNRGDEVELFAVRLGKDIPADLQGIESHRLATKLPSDPAEREHALANLNQIVGNLLSSKSFDLVYERFSLWSYAAMQFSRDRGIPGILEVNAPLIQEQKTYRTLVNETGAKSMRGLCFKNATSIVAVSEQVAEQVRKNYFAQNKTDAIPNGVNCETFLQSTTRPNNRNKVVIGFVGTLKPWHGVDALLSAFRIVHSRNPQTVLKIVGEGPQKEKLEKQLEIYPDQVRQSVYFTGAVPNAEMPQMLSTMDIAVAPYPQIEDFYFSPLKILEYMAAGLPVVASQIGQIPTLIQHNETGLLVSPGCEADLAQSLLSLCDDAPARRRIGSAARRHVEQHHTWQSILDRILATVPPSLWQCETY